MGTSTNLKRNNMEQWMNCLHCNTPLEELGICHNEDCVLKGMDQVPDTFHDLQSFRRQKIVEEAVDMVHGVIHDGSDGTTEETNFLTAAVAMQLMEMAISPFSSPLLAKDMKRRFGQEPAINVRVSTPTEGH